MLSEHPDLLCFSCDMSTHCELLHNWGPIYNISHDSFTIILWLCRSYNRLTYQTSYKEHKVFLRSDFHAKLEDYGR